MPVTDEEYAIVIRERTVTQLQNSMEKRQALVQSAASIEDDEAVEQNQRRIAALETEIARRITEE